MKTIYTPDQANVIFSNYNYVLNLKKQKSLVAHIFDIIHNEKK